MKIGFDAKRLFNNFTGLGNYSRFVVDALANRFPEHAYALYTPRLRHHPETTPYQQGNFIVRTPESVLSKQFASVWRSYALGNVAAQDGVQIFHGLSNELPVTKPASLKTVVTVHDLIFKRFPQYYKAIDVQIYTWKLKKACASADVVIAVSQQTSNDLQEFMQVPASKIQVVYQGCHPNFKTLVSEAQKQEVRKKYNLPHEYLLCVGTLERRKNALTLVKAISKLNDSPPLVLVGKATAYTKEITAFVEANKLQQRVMILQHVSFVDLPAVYQMAHVFVYPSLFEGFGIPIVEAIVSGVPVITSTGSCFMEAGGSGARYVNPENEEELRMQIKAVSLDTDLRNKMITTSQAYIKQFEPPVIAQNLMQVYQSLR
ncbi:MAG: group 1 glycosyl transferase [Bacteroidetes bacterium OLB12]|nr:MAG: group 1 glycosyl transferase [Bacteroidetes bacterium OLB12]HNR73689.1 glycosyltransferase family 1 protein [Cyclobacteriaceae bacterium]